MLSNLTRTKNFSRAFGARGILLVLVMILFSCKEDPPPPYPDFCKSDSGDSQTAGKISAASFKLQDEPQLDYKKDVLPILSSSTEGKVYRCTVCHNAVYSQELTDESAATKMLEEIKSQRMPNGESMDKVAPEDVAIIEKWVTQKFAQPANDNDTKVPLDTGNETPSQPDSNPTPGNTNQDAPQPGTGDANPGKTRC
jgi:hypothetical protein